MRTGKLSVAKVRQITKPGRYGDGGCLYLVVAPGGTKQWVARVTIHGRQTDLGLGGLSNVTLAEAREETGRLRKIARSGGDPRTERRREKLTFAETAHRVYTQLRPTWKNKKHADTWLATVENYAVPTLGDRPIETISTADCLNVLSPIWTEKHETAKRLKQRLATIFDWAKGAGHYPSENPINGLKKALPTVKKSVVHMPALPWRGLPDFMRDLRLREAVSARLLEFMILTAARSGEARGAKWSEIDGDIWVVPADRMKRGVEHRVPLSSEAVAVLEKIMGLDTDLIFPSPVTTKGIRPMSDAVPMTLLRRMGHQDITAHGFRSTFRDWAADFAHADREVAEAALAHATGNAVERAYARSDLFERRRALMDAWGRFCLGGTGDVVTLVRG